MSLHRAQLSKILKIAYADEAYARSIINNDVSAFIRKENMPNDTQEGGGDFHSPIWAAFKNSVFMQDPLAFEQKVSEQIIMNHRRSRLYPILAKGLKAWGMEKRRLMNESILRIPSPRGKVLLQGFDDVEFKVNNFLSLEIMGKGKRLIYPYFSEKPILTNEAARVGLWQLQKSFPGYDQDVFRILDVIRGESFSIAEVPFKGDEQHLFEGHVQNILQMWNNRYNIKTGLEVA